MLVEVVEVDKMHNLNMEVGLMTLVQIDLQEVVAEIHLFKWADLLSQSTHSPTPLNHNLNNSSADAS